MAALQYVDVPGYSAAIFRRTFTDLALPGAIMDRSNAWLADARQRGAAHWNDDRKTWTFPSGATITFGYLENEKDVYRYQGAEFQYVAFDELTQFSEAQYTYLFSRLRRLRGLPVPLRMRSASNPGNIGHGWVKRRFLTERAQSRVFVPAKLDDNPHLDQTEYRASLSHLAPVLRQQLLEGDWGAFEGAAYPAFQDAVHVVDPFPVPAEWERFEFMDFGSSNPTAWYVAAVDYDGNIVVFGEYYSPGLVSEHARNIIDLRGRPDEWGGWETRDRDGNRVPNPVYADPSIRNKVGLTRRGGGAASIEAEFNDYGFSFSHANNDRRAGFIRIAELLRLDDNRYPAEFARHEGPSPQLYVTSRCPHLIEQLRAAPLAADGADRGEAVDGKWESQYGHAHAALRYGVMSRPSRSDEPEREPDDPREALFQRILEGEESRSQRTAFVN